MEQDRDSAGAHGAGPTGDPRVDEALAPLARLAGLPVPEHPAVFERIHSRLAEILASLRAGPQAGGSQAGGSHAGGSQAGNAAPGGRRGA